MEFGVLEGQNFANVMRSISQRRRQGVLEIENGKTPIKIFFVQGKVADISLGGEPPVESCARRMVAAGVLRDSLQLATDTYRALFLSIQKREEAARINRDFFRLVVRQRILDEIYALDTRSGSRFEFKVQLVENDRDFVSPIPIAQILLDMVALESDSARFSEVRNQSGELQILVPDAVDLSQEELVIFDLLPSSAGIDELKKRSLLSSFAFQEALFSLLDQGIIAFPGATHEDTNRVAEGLFGGDALAALDQAIDRGFKEELEARGHAPNDAKELPVSETILGRLSDAWNLRWQANLRSLSFKLLQDRSIPRVLGVIIILAGILVPILFWGSLFLAFSR